LAQVFHQAPVNGGFKLYASLFVYIHLVLILHEGRAQ
jgi:hypothetical protein